MKMSALQRNYEIFTHSVHFNSNPVNIFYAFGRYFYQTNTIP
ncbi:hypothetical protein GCHA_0790 [Paraglaciecola chathamensis S18K6]|uniref:Uncharacterized protein n=1 Tax=Paraglaciecola chathamensis S18K6 TaxID=1127672 RepID=A0AAV3UU51_9ALTE|nr:hypothetical protein GCHA_0790 [Paraglaciecola chathamensis S18K6]